jgi:HlyD family secretion protein
LPCKLEAELNHARASLAVKEAQRQEADATLAEAEQNRDRTRALTEKDIASEAAHEQAEATYQRAMAGVVLSRDVEPGQTVAASLQAPVLFTIAEDLAAMRLEVDIDEADVRAVRAGQTASFTVEAFRDRRSDSTPV